LYTIYDLETGFLYSINGLPYVYGLAFNHAGTELAVAVSGKLVYTFNTKMGDRIHMLDTGYKAKPGELACTKSVTYNPSDQQLAAAYSDGKVDLWNPVTGELEQELDTRSTRGARCVAFSPDGHSLHVGMGWKYPFLES